MHVASSSGALQPVCSLRLHQVAFKQAADVWGHRRVLHPTRQTLRTQAHHQNSTSNVRKPLRRSVACSDAAVPHIPFPGDNQSGAILAALTQDEELPSSSGNSDEAQATPTKSPNNGGPPEKLEPRIPHRWRIIGMMALAFVLCNMDKVSCSETCTAC